MPSIDTSVALPVCQVRDADCPAEMLVGFTEIEAVGAGDAGGGGGGGGAAFFLHAPSARKPPSATTRNNFLMLACFTLSSCDLKAFALGVRRSVFTISNSSAFASYFQ